MRQFLELFVIFSVLLVSLVAIEDLGNSNLKQNIELTLNLNK